MSFQLSTASELEAAEFSARILKTGLCPGEILIHHLHLKDPNHFLTHDSRMEYFNTEFARKTSIDVSHSRLSFFLLSIFTIKLS